MAPRVHVLRSAAPGRPQAVFVHGHYGSARNWTDLSALFSGRLDGYAVDLPGSGRSAPAGCYCLPCTAGTLESVVAGVASGPVHLIGNSYGGTVSLRLAATRPDLVASLTLISPVVPFLNPAWSSHFKRLLRRRDVGPDADAELVVGQALANSCADPASINVERLAELIEDVRATLTTPWRKQAQARSFRGMIWELARSYLPGPRSLQRLARCVTQKTLVVWGACDRVLDPRVSRNLVTLIPHSRLVIIPGAGHLPHLEAPRLVASAIEQHLDRYAKAALRWAPKAAKTAPASPGLAPAVS